MVSIRVLVVVVFLGVMSGTVSADNLPRGKDFPPILAPSNGQTSDAAANKTPSDGKGAPGKNDQSKSSDLDSSLAAGLAQALATVTAVIIGYVLSILAERRSWSRRKQEQLRERQLTALITFLSVASDAVQSAKRALPTFLQISNEMSHAISGCASTAALEAKHATLLSKIGTFPTKLGEILRELELKLMELKLLKYGTEGDVALFDFVQEMTGLHAEAAVFYNGMSQVDSSSLELKVKLVEERLTAIINNGVTHLHG